MGTGSQCGVCKALFWGTYPIALWHMYAFTMCCQDAGNGEPAVEVPLDGTVYDLDTGRVLEWCPKNNPIRMLLGSLKVCPMR